MDVEKLAKELILKNMTPEQQMAVLEGIKSTVAEAKEVQKRKIGENVDIVVQALKKIEADIRSRYDDVGNAIEKRVASIKDGRDGKDGKDGRDGKDGKAGRDGAKGDKGDAGRDGRDGVDGVDGISVTSARIDFDGSLIIVLSSGVELNVGEVVAPDLAERIKVITNGGGTSQSVLDTLASLQTQINNLIPSQTGNSGKFLTTNGSALSWSSVAGALSYQGTWNASTNTPTLASSTGTNGYYYIVATAGSTNLNGITDWQVGDWLLFNGTVWQKIDQSETLQFVTSADASVTVTTTGSTADLAVYSSPRLVSTIRNETGATLTKGTVVYISGASGNKATVSKAIATSDSTSAQTFALVLADISNNNNGTAILAGDISGLDTSAFANGTQLYLSSTTAGTYTSTKQYAPNHLVYIGVVTRSHVNQGSIEVRIQNGYELDELHDVSAQSPSNGQTLIRNNTTGLWEKANLTAGTGISVSNGAGSITINNTGVTSVGVTSPVASTGGTTPTISLASGYGDTQNPYGSKTANYVLAAPNGSAGVPTFRAIVAADIPFAVAKAGDTMTGNLTVPSLTDSGNLTFTGTGNRITGDFSNATQANKVAFQTSTTNGATVVAAISNGSSTISQWRAYNGNDPDNSAWIGIVANGLSQAQLTSGITGTGTYLPMTFLTGGSERMRIDTSGNVGIGTSSPSSYGIFTTYAASNPTITIVSGNANAYLRLYSTSDNNMYLTNTGGSMTMITANTERMRIDSSGNVGIGTTGGTYGLDLVRSATNGSTIRVYNSTASAGTLLQVDTSGVAYLLQQANAALAFATNNSERMRIDSSGNVLVGATGNPAAAKFFVAGTSAFGTAGAPEGQLTIDGTNAYLDARLTGGGLIFRTNGSSEKMRIDSSGRLLINTTTTGSYFDGPLCAYNASSLVASFKTDSATAYPLACYSTATSGNNLFITFLTEGTPTTRGYIDYNRAGTAVRYNTSSDERLKKNIVDAGSAIPLINSIKIRSFDWKETDSHVDFGVIAQELNTVAPDAVSEGTTGDDMTKTWGVDTSTLVPALVKAIQEQQALITALTARITALESN